MITKMDDNIKKSSSHRININEEYEVQYWASRFHISQNKLKQTVEIAGTSYTNEVEQYLRQHM